ncbi:MAG: PKD domain-containing protein [Bacteroidota bacterium]
MRKNFYATILFFFSFLGLLYQSYATHLMGVDITYECIGPCTYRIVHKSYYDCTGGAFSGFVPVSPFNQPTSADAARLAALTSFTITANGGCPAPTALGNGWNLESLSEVTPLCPDVLVPMPGVPSVTGCDGTNPNPTINGVAELVMFRDYNFCNVPANCDNYTLSWGVCCRNAVITSLVAPSSSGIGSNSTTLNPSLASCNSSPSFSNKPVPYICEGQNFTFNQGAIDPDGDSLSYELGDCLDNTLVPVNYGAGYTSQQPLGTTWDVNINPLTGDISMLPNPSGIQVTVILCVVVKEWRNGNLINEITRDMQITVIPNCQQANPITGGVQNMLMGPDVVPANPLSFNEVRTCAGTEVCFDIPVISQDPNFEYEISWNQGIPGATFADANNPAVQNTISGANPVGRFCWTPPVGTDGAFFFVVSVRDDACPIPGFNQFTIIVYVEDVHELSSALITPLGCNEMELAVNPQSTLPSPYANIFTSTTWSGNGNLNRNPNINDQTLSHLYPAPGSYFTNVMIQDTLGCTSNISGVANLTTGVTADAGPDLTLCSNFTTQLGTPAIPGQTYTWTPSTSIDNPSIAQPTFSFPNNGQGQTSTDYTVEVTDGTCRTFDYVTVNVNPSLVSTISPAVPKICRGDSIDLVATNNLGSGNTFLWNTGETSASIRVSPQTSTTYSVVSFNSGCASTPVFVNVEVQEGPQAIMGGDFGICPGSSTTLTASGADSYVWSAGGFAGSSITLAGISQDSSIYVVGFDDIGCPGDTTFGMVNVLPEPIADYSTTVVCEGNETDFSDISSLASGNLVAWSWDFGDSSPTDINQNPTHVYTNAGNYQVNLTVTSDRGCQNTISNQVTVNPSPIVDFTFTNVCEQSPNLFLDVSTISSGSIANYTWTFGDNTPSQTGQNVLHQYNNFGFYNATLTATSDQGCVSSFTQTVFVSPIPTASFDIVSACVDSLVLVSTSSTVEGTLDFIAQHDWNFGDPASGVNNTSSDVNPIHIYSAPGFYTVTLTVTTGNGCTNTVQTQIEVFEEPVADFVPDKTCENDLINFLNQTAIGPNTPVEYAWWDFGNGSTQESIVGRTQYFDNGPGVYDVTLAVRTTAGCVDTVTKAVTIDPAPEAIFATSNVCLDEPNIFSSDASSILTGSIASYSWDFGDPAASTSNEANPIFTYPDPGTYQVRMVLTSDLGCVGGQEQEIIVHELPQILELQEATVCFGDAANLIVRADPGVVINWYFNQTDTEPFHRGNAYVTPPLPFQTTYYVAPESEVGCEGQRQAINGFVYNDEELNILTSADVVELPLALINFSANSTIGIDSWSWDFGDGNRSNETAPSHEYKYPGKFLVTLKTVDVNGCELTVTTLVEVLKRVNISMPSAFSPNGDGFNDFYKIGHYKISNFFFQVFNRWGQLVFETDNPDFEWDGRTLDGRMAQEGVYVYVMRALDFEGVKIDQSRTITITK